MGLSDFTPRYFDLAENADVVVLTCKVSHINDEENIEELGHEMFALVDQFGFNKVVLNMAGVEYVTSSVVGKMITMHRKLHRSNGQLVICELSSGVYEVLNASRLLSYFTCTETQEAALTILQPTPPHEEGETVDL